MISCRRIRIPLSLLVGWSSRSSTGWSSTGSAALPRPLVTLMGNIERSEATASTLACTHGNAARALMLLMADMPGERARPSAKSAPATWLVVPSGRTSTSFKARSTRATHVSLSTSEESATFRW